MPILSESTPTKAPNKVVNPPVAGHSCDYALFDNIPTELNAEEIETRKQHSNLPPCPTQEEIERRNENIKIANEDKPRIAQEEPFRDIQQDRAAVMEMEGIHTSRFKEVMDRLFIRMREENMKVIEHHNSRRGKHHPFKGGSTGTIVLYDPKNFRLKVGSKGDSPAYVVVQSGEKSRLIKISNPNSEIEIDDHPQHPGRTITVKNTLDTDSNVGNFPYLVGSPMFDEVSKMAMLDRHPTGLIDLKQVIADACSKWEKDDKDGQKYDPAQAKISLILSSDGVIQRDYGTRQDFADIFAEAERKVPPVNIAKALIDYTTSEKKDKTLAVGRDNCSAIVLRDLKQDPRGTSIALCICDGLEKDGHLMAEAGIRAFEDCIKQETKPGFKPVKAEIIHLPQQGKQEGRGDRAGG